MTTKQFKVNGLHCAGCAQAAQNALCHVPGVSEATVELTSRTARVTYDEARVTPDDLKAAVDQAGYVLVEP